MKDEKKLTFVLNFPAVLVLLWLVLSGCSQQPSVLSGKALTVPYTIIIGSSLSAKQEKEIVEMLQIVFEEIDLVFNDWNPHSEISQLNHLKGNVEVPISSKLEHLFQKIDKIVKLTKGLFDPTVGGLSKLWKNALEQGMQPNEAALAQARKAVGWEKIHFEKGVFYKDNDDTQIDLGSVVKGYCVDLIIENLQRIGYENALVNWGGEVRANGKHPEDRPWRVFISNSGNNDPNASLGEVELLDQAVATSGNYLQKWTIVHKGTPITYTHIIHPQTGFPLIVNEKSIASISVVAPTCFMADAMATAGILGYEIDEPECIHYIRSSWR